MRRSLLCAWMVAGVLTFGAAAAEQPSLQTALVAYARGDYKTAYDQLFPLAVQGDAEAQYLLGIMSQLGQGMEPDEAAARRWYHAAALGHAHARRALQQLGEAQAVDRGPDGAAGAGNPAAGPGLQRHAATDGFDAAAAAYERGDFEAAYPELLRPAQQYNPRALYLLGLMHEKGQGVPRDDAAAAKWYREAANLGDGDARFNLAVLYEHGRGVPQDLDEAHRLYAAAASRGHPDAPAAVDRLTFHRFGGKMPAGASELDAALHAFAEGKSAWAVEQLRPLAEAGDVEAQYALAFLHESDFRAGGGPGEARRWYRAAAEQGDGLAQLALANTYANQFQGLAPDHAEAVRWYRAAAEQGNPDAQLALGHAYNDGKGIVRDAAEANRWYKTAHRTEAGVNLLIESSCAGAAAVPELAPVYAACNRGDENTALQALTALARQGSAVAQVWFAYLHYAGREIRPSHALQPPLDGDVHRGARWYRAAAEQGDAVAQYNLGVVYEYGMGVAANRDEALRWCQAAADQGQPRAQAALQLLAGKSKAGGPKVDAALAALARGEEERVVAELATLAFQGNAEAQSLMGAMYLSGRHLRLDYAEAAKSYRAAAEQKHAGARYFLGAMHEHGLGMDKDEAQAIRWYKSSGDPYAKMALKRLGG